MAGAGVLLFSMGGAALTPALAGPNDCSVSGTSATCKGDQSDGVVGGVDFPTSVTTLKVRSWGGLIAPPDGAPGIFDLFDTSISVNTKVDITTTGGTDAISLEGPGAINLLSRGDLTSDRRAIYANSWTDGVTIDSKGDITAGEDGIFAQGDGLISVTSKGDIDAAFKGIFANSYSGPVSVTSKGDIDAFFDAIWTQGDGQITINSQGDLSSSNVARGIFANSFSDGVSITSKGDISAALDLIWAQGLNDVSINSTGDLIATGLGGAEGRGIFANSFAGMVDITSRGDITAHLDAIWAEGQTGVSIDSQGAITNTGYSRGIYALSQLGPVTVSSVGEINAYLDGIWAQGNGAVSVSSVGEINSGNFARGIYAESLTSTVTVNSQGDLSSDLEGIFARGAGDVSVTSVGSIMPVHNYGDQRGIFAQSLGGAVTVNSTGDISVSLESIWAKGTEAVSVTSTGTLNSTSLYARGIYAESQYKGTSVWNKGDINSGAEAIYARGVDDVSVWNDGDLTTDTFRVLFAQSTNGKVTVDTTGDIYTNDATNSGEGIFVSGFSGVDLTNHGDVTSNSFRGIYAESEAGPITINTWGDISALGTKGSNGEAIFADNNGPVTVYSRGDLTSTEFRGTFLQSRSDALNVDSMGTVQARYEGYFLSAGTDLTATIMGDVTSDQWRGILVSRAVSGNDDGTISLTYGGGTVQSNGSDPDKWTNGIEADAFGGIANVMILSDGIVTGGSNNTSGNYSYAVYFKSGTNTLTNYGEINEDNGGRAIGGEGGDDTVENYGLVEGSIYLGLGMNAFNNRAGGVYASGDTIDVGAGNAVTNWGQFSPGGTGIYFTTNFTSGNLVNTAPGELVVDIDFDTPATSDHITGVDVADMGGYVRANVQDLNLTYGATQTATILTANTVNDDGITGAAQGAVHVDVNALPTQVDITVGLDFAADGLAGNEAGMGDYLQGIFAGGVPGPLQSAFLALAGIPTTAAYGEAIAALGPEGYAALNDSSLNANAAFTQNLFSCPTVIGGDRFAEGRCVWAVAQARESGRDSGAGTYGFSDKAYSISAGAQTALDGAWRIGFGLGYESGNYTSGTTTADRSLYNAGLVVKNKIQDYDIAVALTGGGQHADAVRTILVPSGEALSDQSLYFGSLTGKVSRVFQYGGGYIKPAVEAAGTWLSMPGYTETGAGPLNLTVLGSDDFVARFTPSVEFGMERMMADGILFRPFVRLGASLYGGADSSITGGFEGLDTMVTLPISRDTAYGEIAVGADVIAAANWSVRGLYQGRFSENSHSNAFSLKAAIDF